MVKPYTQISCESGLSNFCVLDEATVFLLISENVDEGQGIAVSVTLDIPSGHTLDVDVTVTVNTALDTSGTNPGRYRHKC